MQRKQKRLPPSYPSKEKNETFWNPGACVSRNLRNDIISELATYGVIKEGTDGMCEILNPIYLYCIMQVFKPPVNGLEQAYFPEETDDSNF